MRAPWIWTSRPGFDADLAEELGRRGLKEVKPLGHGLVSSLGRPEAWPIFARTGFAVAAEVPAEPAAITEAIGRALAGGRKSWLLLAWVPDHDATNPQAGQAAALAEAVIAGLPEALALRRVDGAEAVRYGGLAVQLCLDGGLVRVGVVDAADLPTLAPGGRSRSAMPKDAPSRAGRKLEEALAWIGRGPEAGEVCVDLGAAPGGWTAVLVGRRARVIAVDPAKLAPELVRRKGISHVQASAFDFAPDEPVDWLFCDMAWRPLEVAQLLAKWGRRGWASALVANIKLPMKQRVEFADKVIAAVAAGGWRDVRGRQLYHDREEITIAAWRV